VLVQCDVKITICCTARTPHDNPKNFTFREFFPWQRTGSGLLGNKTEVGRAVIRIFIIVLITAYV